MLRARCGAPSMRPVVVRSLPRTRLQRSTALPLSTSRSHSIQAQPRSLRSVLPIACAPLAVSQRGYSNKPRRIFQVSGIPDPQVMGQTQADLSRINHETPLYFSLKQRKYIRYFLGGACVQLIFTSLGAHMLYSAWELQKDGPEFLLKLSQQGMLMLCAGFIFIGLACFWLVRHNARRRITSLTLLPGGKKLRATVFTMLGRQSAPFEFDLDDITRGKWVAHEDSRNQPGFYVKGKRVGYSLDPAADVANLPLLKTVIKHPV